MATVQKAGSTPSNGAGSRMRDYFGSLKYEWQKISWPEKKQWVQSTIVVFVFVMILMLVLLAFDWVASIVIDNMLRLR